MNAHIKVPCANQTCMGITNLDLEPIKFQLIVKEGWTLNKADRVAEEYRSHLISIKEGNDGIIPSKDIDEFWHAHILDTRKYVEDCDKFMGRFIHHFPYLGLRGEEDFLDWKERVEHTRTISNSLLRDTFASGCDDCCGIITKDGEIRPGRKAIEEYIKEKVLPGWEGTDYDRR